MVGALVSALTGSGAIEVVVWAAATALSAAASVAFAAAQQGVERHVLTRVATYVFGLLAHRCAVQRGGRGGRVVQPGPLGQPRHRARRDHDRGFGAGAGGQRGTGRTAGWVRFAGPGCSAAGHW